MSLMSDCRAHRLCNLEAVRTIDIDCTRMLGWRTWIAVLTFAAPCASAQSARPQFDVAAIHENTTAAPGGFVRFLPDGGIHAEHLTFATLITVAWQLERWEVLGVPNWAQQVTYDIDARPPSRATRTQTYEMMQSLLEERVGLAMHRERKEIDAFVLTRMREDRVGAGLMSSSLNCAGPLPLPPACLVRNLAPDEFKPKGARMARLAGRLSSQLDAPVSDETGLAGVYDFDLVWSNDGAPAADRPGLFTALQEQLGLRLERRKVTIDVWVVDRITRPTPN